MGEQSALWDRLDGEEEQELVSELEMSLKKAGLPVPTEQEQQEDVATWESFGSEGDQGLVRMTEETLKDAGQEPPDQYRDLGLRREDGKPWSSFDSDGDQSLILTMDRSMLEFDKRKQENKSKDDWLSGIQKYPLEEDIKNEMSREGIKEPSTETTESSSPPLPTPTVSPGVLGVGGENVPDRALPPLSPPIPTDGWQPMPAKKYHAK